MLLIPTKGKFDPSVYQKSSAQQSLSSEKGDKPRKLESQSKSSPDVCTQYNNKKKKINKANELDFRFQNFKKSNIRLTWL